MGATTLIPKEPRHSKKLYSNDDSIFSGKYELKHECLKGLYPFQASGEKMFAF
jgi:hypothetical protein